MKLIPFLLSLSIGTAFAQQVPDATFDPKIEHPAYANGKGPLVLVDGAHHNFHQIKTRYAGFAKALRNDGYLVEANEKPFF